MYFIINKVLFDNKALNIEEKISVECLGMHTKKYEATNYLNQLKHITIFNEDIILNSVIHTEMITNKDLDGYHLVVDKNENIQKYNIYLKQSKTNKGYIYNSVDITINYVGFIEIVEYTPKIEKLEIKKRIIVEDSDSDDNVCDREYSKKTKKPKLSTTNKVNDIDNKHIYVELNDKLIEELKKKLEQLSLKKNE